MKKFKKTKLLVLVLTSCNLFAQTYSVEKNVMVPMRDGIKLATDIYFPAEKGKGLDGTFPVIFHRTPYNKESINLNSIDFFCKNGVRISMYIIPG